jgi:hypothetical protein
MDQYDNLAEIAKRLAERCGLGREVNVFKIYPELDIKADIETSVERLKSANQELTRQNDALEEQRVRLLRQLRVHADQMGTKSLKYFGLTAEQMVLVNEFAENLRDVSGGVRWARRRGGVDIVWVAPTHIVQYHRTRGSRLPPPPPARPHPYPFTACRARWTCP